MIVSLFGNRVELSQEQVKELEKISHELKEKRRQCRQVCATWNCEDRDCEIYGSQHPSPSTCTYFLIHELKTKEE